jgi:AhpD family alkylhydroperoxidase
MATGAKSFYDEWSSRMTHAKAAAPQTVKGFGTLYQSVMKAGALDVREKELIALGIGMALRCESCIYTHVEKAVKAGASREQIIEAAGVAVMMQGGPTYTYLPTIVEALDALDAQATPIEQSPQPTVREAGQPA